MAKRQVTYKRRYKDIRRPKMPVTIIPNHSFDSYDKPATKGEYGWWIEIPTDELDNERGVRLNAAEMHDLMCAIEAALDDADRSMEEAVTEHNKFVERIVTRSKRNTEEAK